MHELANVARIILNKSVFGKEHKTGNWKKVYLYRLGKMYSPNGKYLTEHEFRKFLIKKIRNEQIKKNL